jgi:hypothetical protein
MDVRFPTRLREDVLEAVLAGHRASSGVLGVLLSGSLARGTARQDSDIDLLLVLADGRTRRFDRQHHGPIVVEQNTRTAADWTEQFTPSRIGDESWGYAFLDGVILYDPHGAVAQLVAAAADAQAAYRLPDPIRAHYTWSWDHVRPKLEAVLRLDDATEIGWAVAAMTEHLMKTLWAINGRSLPSLDLGCFQRHLDDLAVPPEAPTLVRAMLQAPPKEGVRWQLRILELALPYLPTREAPAPSRAAGRGRSCRRDVSVAHHPSHVLCCAIPGHGSRQVRHKGSRVTAVRGAPLVANTLTVAMVGN